MYHNVIHLQTLHKEKELSVVVSSFIFISRNLNTTLSSTKTYPCPRRRHTPVLDEDIPLLNTYMRKADTKKAVQQVLYSLYNSLFQLLPSLLLILHQLIPQLLQAIELDFISKSLDKIHGNFLTIYIPVEIENMHFKS